MGGFREVQFKDLYLEPSKNGVYKKKEFHGRGCKIVNMGELFGYDFVGPQDMKRIELTEKEKTKSLLKNGDLLFGRRSLVEEGSGKCSIVKGITEGTTFESSIIRVRPDQSKVNPLYLYYYFKSIQGRSRVLAISSGTNVKGIRGSDLQNIFVSLPDLVVQNEIVNVLQAYDNLIENNRRRITILEEMAQSLYREWFVKFRFPGHENAKFIDSPLGKIPEGWSIKRLDDFVVLQRGFDLPKKKRNEEGRVPIYAASGINGYHDEVKVKAPGLVTGRSGTLGVVSLVLEDFWPLNTALWVKEFKQCTAFYAFYLLKSIGLGRFNSGASVPTLNRNDVHGYQVVSPPESIIATFENVAGSMLKERNALHRAKVKLKEQRDLILPKVISGGISIGG